ncbi:hypothetical protein CVT26_007708 [Gymnopilus dilepis]|uniref:Uncharacterized protein n=1 Tax=Gymnopilus dilepis TaxID=231916 RepID=A0A409WIM3_9AGAR|nr:hypothetical protein CVT26_007708 [Gymnopilus dilepis]
MRLRLRRRLNTPSQRPLPQEKTGSLFTGNGITERDKLKKAANGQIKKVDSSLEKHEPACIEYL